jgi:hypothetical protein
MGHPSVTFTDVAAFGSTHHAGAIPAGLVAPRTSELTVAARKWLSRLIPKLVPAMPAHTPKMSLCHDFCI